MRHDGCGLDWQQAITQRAPERKLVSESLYGAASHEERGPKASGREPLGAFLNSVGSFV